MTCKDIKTSIDSASRRDPVAPSVKSHLMECTDCSSYSDQTMGLIALLKAQPRVEAPSDFDFKLRARIARAKSEPESTSILGHLWAKTFSWGQTATAAAALGLVLTFVTYNYMHTDPNAIVQGVSTSAVASLTEQALPAAAASLPTEAAKTTRVASRNVHQPVLMPALEKSGVENQGNQRNDGTWKAYNSEKRQIVAAPSSSTLVGAEGYAVKTAAFVPSI